MKIVEVRNQLRHTESAVCMQRQFVGKAHHDGLAVACTNARARYLTQEAPDHVRTIGRMPNMVVPLLQRDDEMPARSKGVGVLMFTAPLGPARIVFWSPTTMRSELLRAHHAALSGSVTTQRHWLYERIRRRTDDFQVLGDGALRRNPQHQ